MSVLNASSSAAAGIAVVTSLLATAGTSALADDQAACQAALQTANQSNATQLWNGAGECRTAGDTDGATFLLLAGQIRAMTDMGTLEADSDQEELKVADLYGALYYRTGGSGDDDLYRNLERTQALFDRLGNWMPVMDESYDPGWSYKKTVDDSEYGQMLACQKAVRVQRLGWYSSLIQNDEYFAANRELNELRAKNPGAVAVGSDLEKQMSALFVRMREATANLPMPTSQPPECDFAMVYEPDPDADFTNLYVGTNGPGDSGAYIYESRKSVLDSWVSRSLPADELTDLLDQVRFDEQILVGLSFGKRTSATGNVYISNVDYNSVLKSLSVSGIIGVNGAGCEQPRSIAFPFALAVAPRPDTVPSHPGLFLQNFPDGCKPPITGAAVTP